MTEWIDRPSITDAQVSAFRLHRHHLDIRAPRGRLPGVVGDVCGVQAQIMSMAQIALWARLRDLRLGDLERALEERRTIAKTWSMRGTLHLHSSEELPVILGGLLPTRLLREQRWIGKVGLNEERTTALVLRALEDGPLPRSQLARYLAMRLGTRTKHWSDGGWGHKTVGASLTWYLVRPAMVRGLVCFGPSDGQEVTFARTDRWLRESQPMPPESEAEEAFVRRYLGSFGPSDVHDIKAWSGVHVRRIRATLERLRGELVEVDRNGRLGLLLRKDLPHLEKAVGDPGLVRLLPRFDAFMLGHYERTHLVDRAQYKQVYKDQGWLAPVVLLDGRVAGTWSYERRPGNLNVAVKMFVPFTKEMRKSVEEEALDLSRFLEVGDVAVRFAK